MGNRQATQRSLENIPVEILSHISLYVDGRTIICSLSLVCNGFQAIFSDPVYWRSRVTDTQVKLPSSTGS